MWLEQTVWIWAPLACAAMIWTTWRIATLHREVQNLRERVIQLERAFGDSGRTEGVEPMRSARMRHQAKLSAGESTGLRIAHCVR
jgi:hypothetical protein